MNLKVFDQISIYNYNHTLKTNLLIDEILSRKCKENELIIRFWVSEGVVFGKLDTTCENFEKGKTYLEQMNVLYAIRKSGGLAVVLDSGTLNISFIHSRTKMNNHLHDSYKMIVLLLQDFMTTYDIGFTTSNVHDSYCPGDYDLVLNGKKFCGIAQYRNKDNIIVMLNILVNGNQKNRLRTIKDFYEIANTSNKSYIPNINENSMETLEKLTKLQTTPELIVKDFKFFLCNNHSNVSELPKID